MIEYLPADSATVVQATGPAAEWSTTEYLLAHIFDALNLANWQRGQGKDADRPKPLQRPSERTSSTKVPAKQQQESDEKPQKKFATPAELRDFVNSLHKSI